MAVGDVSAGLVTPYTIALSTHDIRPTQKQYDWCFFLTRPHLPFSPSHLVVSCSGADIFLADTLGLSRDSRIYRDHGNPGANFIIQEAGVRLHAPLHPPPRHRLSFSLCLLVVRFSGIG